MHKILTSLISRHQKKVRFLMAGGFNTIIGLSVYPALYILLSKFGFGYIEILIPAQIIAITFSFVTNKYFVFKTIGNLKAEYLKFIVFHGIYFFLNLIFLPFFVEIFGMSPILSQIIFSIFVIMLSYSWHTYITFKPPGRLF